MSKKKVEFLVVDTSAFIKNLPLQDYADNLITCKEVVAEITNKRQLRRLVVLPYDLQIKDVDAENIRIVTEFSKKTGDYLSLSANDIKVMALTYQLEKEKLGVSHLRTEPLYQKSVNVTNASEKSREVPNLPGFYFPESDDESIEELEEQFENLNKDLSQDVEEILECSDHENEAFSEDEASHEENKVSDEIKASPENISEPYEDDNPGCWITPRNIRSVTKKMNGEITEDKEVMVACMTTDFAMQNVLKQLNLNVACDDGKMIKQLRTYILRCYTCFKTTSLMTKKFCPKCGNNTLKRVSVSLDEDGKMQIHINASRPLSGKGKKHSLPRIRGGKHPNNPILVEDQPMAQNRPSRIARTKTNVMQEGYEAGFSPFAKRDVNSRSAQLHIRPEQQYKQWAMRNPNENRRNRK